MIPMPNSPLFTDNVAKHGVSALHCAICGVPSPEVRSLVHVIQNGAAIGTPEELTGTLGLWPVCQSCLTTYPQVTPFVIDRGLAVGEANSIDRLKYR